MKKQDLRNFTYEELVEIFTKKGEKAFRAKQVFNWVQNKMISSIDEITVLSKSLRDKLSKEYDISKMKILKKFESKIDATKKYLFILEDGNIIESVMMKYKHGISVCVSTQIGCKMGCDFCASTKDGLIRNLTASEILGQIYEIQKDINRNVKNIVLMGSGEPLDNYKNVVKFLKIIHDEKGQNISYRNITISTCGLVPQIYNLANEKKPITLSISLHTPFDHERRRIMPIALKYGIDEIIKACKYYIKTTKRRVSFEYTLIQGVNDTEKHANELIKLLDKILCHVNIIPLNPIKEVKYQKSNKKAVEKFHKLLNKSGINSTIRREMGVDIEAACGQLRRSYQENTISE